MGRSIQTDTHITTPTQQKKEPTNTKQPSKSKQPIKKVVSNVDDDKWESF